jgi:hypothetical protein
MHDRDRPGNQHPTIMKNSPLHYPAEGLYVCGGRGKGWSRPGAILAFLEVIGKRVVPSHGIYIFWIYDNGFIESYFDSYCHLLEITLIRYTR